VASRQALVVVHERAGMATAIRALGSDERLQIASLIDLAIPPQRAAAYGLGGGTMGIDNKLQLPTGAKYRQLGNAATTNLGFGPQF
jgi:hypothetical protein